VAATELKPVYLLTGSDRPKIGRALQRLRTRVGEDAVEHLDAPPATGDDAVAACNALGFFAAEARLVVVGPVDKWKATDVKAVAAYLESPAPATVLALVAAELKADSPLGKAVAKVGQVLAFSVPKRNLQAWVAEQFKAAGARAEPDACAALVQLVDDRLHARAGVFHHRRLRDLDHEAVGVEPERLDRREHVAHRVQVGLQVLHAPVEEPVRDREVEPERGEPLVDRLELPRERVHRRAVVLALGELRVDAGGPGLLVLEQLVRDDAALRSDRQPVAPADDGRVNLGFG